jgi:transcriptional regulator with XRE-family HTH domain
MDDVGKRIREIRKARNMTQDQLAVATGLSKSFISEVENDSRNASSKNMVKIANALGASVEYLLRGVSAAAPAAVGTESAVNVPPQLALAAERLRLSFSETLDLLQTQQSVVARRGTGAPKELTVDNWVDLHKTIKKVFG